MQVHTWRIPMYLQEYVSSLNADGTQGTHRPGSNGGVTFLLDAEVDEYFVGPLSYAEGFMVSYHYLCIILWCL